MSTAEQQAPTSN